MVALAGADGSTCASVGDVDTTTACAKAGEAPGPSKAATLTATPARTMPARRSLMAGGRPEIDASAAAIRLASAWLTTGTSNVTEPEWVKVRLRWTTSPATNGWVGFSSMR